MADDNNMSINNIRTEAYAAYVNKDTIRSHSTSGGLFTLLAERTISAGGVVYGAAFDEDLHVVHTPVRSLDELDRLRRAKYAPSRMGNTFAEVKALLEQGTPVLFSGTPCQVAGLHHYLKLDAPTLESMKSSEGMEELSAASEQMCTDEKVKSHKSDNEVGAISINWDRDKLILMDLVCHGVPTEKAWESYLKFRQQEDQQETLASEVNFRSKSTGWGQYSVSMKYPSGYEYSCKSHYDSYMIAFVGNMILRPACNKCQFKGVERCSDFTLGDFWGVWDLKPEMNDDKGISTVLVHSEKGKRIWQELCKKVISEPLTLEESYHLNPSMIEASAVHPMRDELLSRIETEGFAPVEAEAAKIRKERMEHDAAVEKANRSLIRRVKRKVKRILYS